MRKKGAWMPMRERPPSFISASPSTLLFAKATTPRQTATEAADASKAIGIALVMLRSDDLKSVKIAAERTTEMIAG